MTSELSDEVITVDEFHRKVEANAVGPKAELIRGRVHERMSKSPLHTRIASLLFARLYEALPNFWVRMEQPLTLSDSEPEPDISVVPGAIDDYLNHPNTALLVVEVALNSEAVDRRKGQVYAEAGVGEFWLVVPERRVIEVHSAPSPAGWGKVVCCWEGELIRTGIAQLEGLAVSEFLR
ncbi:MAG: Uma2 family endonuclease [Verrucomicrobiales bacterium]